MLKDIVKAKYITDYKIRIDFEDGKKGVVDFSTWTNKGVLKKLKTWIILKNST